MVSRDASSLQADSHPGRLTWTDYRQWLAVLYLWNVLGDLLQLRCRDDVTISVMVILVRYVVFFVCSVVHFSKSQHSMGDNTNCGLWVSWRGGKANQFFLAFCLTRCNHFCWIWQLLAYRVQSRPTYVSHTRFDQPIPRWFIGPNDRSCWSIRWCWLLHISVFCSDSYRIIWSSQFTVTYFSSLNQHCSLIIRDLMYCFIY